MENIFINLAAIPTMCIIKIVDLMKSKNDCKICSFDLLNEIKPIDLYCYLYSKFGKPNGIQSILRSNDSDNLIHWEWTLGNDSFILLIQGMSFRTEIHLIGNLSVETTKENLIATFKSDFKNYGKLMSELRSKLEKWTEFTNPYYRVHSSIINSLAKISELNIDPEKDRIEQPKDAETLNSMTEIWNKLNSKYYFAIGLAFGIRTMLPVLGESFINMLLFILAKPEIKNNKRLFDSITRQNVDIRVQSLHLNCFGFTKPIDYSSNQCKKFHSLINERNDLLHGNVKISKLTYNELYFNGTVPIFNEYGNFWSKSIGQSLNSVNFFELYQDFDTVIDFINYVMEHLDEKTRTEVDMIISKQDLGFNKQKKHIGILFPDHLVDFRLDKSVKSNMNGDD